MTTIDNIDELNTAITEQYIKHLQEVVIDLLDDFEGNYFEDVVSDIDDVRYETIKEAFNCGSAYYDIEGTLRPALIYEVINRNIEYLMENCPHDTLEMLNPVNEEKMVNIYAYQYATDDMITQTDDSLSKKILILQRMILSIYEENENKKTIKNFAERISIKSLINTKFGNGLVSDLIFTHYDTE